MVCFYGIISLSDVNLSLLFQPPQSTLDFVMNERKFRFPGFPAPTLFLLRVLSGKESIGKHNLASYLLLYKSDWKSRFSVTRHTRNLDCQLWSIWALSAFSFACNHIEPRHHLNSKSCAMHSQLLFHNFGLHFIYFAHLRGSSWAYEKGWGCRQIEKTNRKAKRGLAG